MKYKRLGTSEMQVSILGLGTVKLGRDQGVKYPKKFTIPDDREAKALLTFAQDNGINLIDTAPAYGNSETRLGTLLGGQRKNWIICSKTGEEFENGFSRFNFSAQHTRYSVERSLSRLQTDYIDIVLVHSDGNDLDIINNTDAFDALANLKQQGKIRAYGMSTKTLAGSLLAAQHSDVVMLTYNITDKSEEPAIQFCHENHKAVLVKKAFGSGHLLTNGEDPVQHNMNFIFGNPGITSAIIGTITIDHLKYNIECADLAYKNN